MQVGETASLISVTFESIHWFDKEVKISNIVTFFMTSMKIGSQIWERYFINAFTKGEFSHVINIENQAPLAHGTISLKIWLWISSVSPYSLTGVQCSAWRCILEKWNNKSVFISVVSIWMLVFILISKCFPLVLS